MSQTSKAKSKLIKDTLTFLVFPAGEKFSLYFHTHVRVKEGQKARVAIWPLKRPNQPNLVFLKQFAKNKMIWPFFGLFCPKFSLKNFTFIWPFSHFRIWPFLKLSNGQIWPFLLFCTWQPCAKLLLFLSFPCGLEKKRKTNSK